jgi:3',5'-cyclic AMP phosphodiesterase CpdA
MNQVAKPDLVINLGDVIEDETLALDEQRYRRFQQILAELDCGVLHVAGNHDTINLSDEHLLALWGKQQQLYYSKDIEGFHLAVLRSIEERGKRVHIPAAQIRWLEADLAQTRLPTLVFVHHPLAEMDLSGNRWFEKARHICLISNRSQVRSVLKNSGKVRAVFNGHAHWNHLDVIDGIPFVTLQSLVENVDDDMPGRPAAAHAIVDVSSTQMRVYVAGLEPARYQFDTT